MTLFDKFNRHPAYRIALVSILLASLASPLAWWRAKAAAEETIVTLAADEAKRLLGLSGSRPGVFSYTDVNRQQVQAVADAIVGGLLDVVTIYDAQGRELAKSMSHPGTMIALELPRESSRHTPPRYTQSHYKSLQSPYTNLWLLRVFVPQYQFADDPRSPIVGYLEGVRIMPQWQQDQILHNSLLMALLVGIASLVCGAVLYPVVVSLIAENSRKTHEVLESNISMMEALGRTIAKRDSDTGLHNYRVAWIAARIGEEMRLQGSAMQSLIAGSFLHDVGKIAIPDAILLKPGPLTDSEMAIMRTHVAQGESIVGDIGWLAGANAVVAGHHEKWNGMERVTRAGWWASKFRLRHASLRSPMSSMPSVPDDPIKNRWNSVRRWKFCNGMPESILIRTSSTSLYPLHPRYMNACTMPTSAMYVA